ncbi:hypothetical protein BDR07DRAFT_1227806, partial [Suillus spraguei]
MTTLSAEQTNQILYHLDLNQSTKDISHATGVHYSTISRICSTLGPDLQKSSGGCPSILSSSDVQHAIWLISSGKAENATQLTISSTSLL